MKKFWERAHTCRFHGRRIMAEHLCLYTTGLESIVRTFDQPIAKWTHVILEHCTTYFDGILQKEDTPLGLSLVTNIAITLPGTDLYSAQQPNALETRFVD